MLGKLIKYDFKSLNRYLLIVHAFLLLSAVAVRVFLTEPLNVNFFDSEANGMIFMGIFILYTLIIVGTSFATCILVAVRFYKNLYSDEGYLTFTLPVTRSQLLLSKTIAGTVWVFINTFLVFMCMAIVIWTSEVSAGYHANDEKVLEALGFTGAYANLTFSKVILFLLLVALVEAISTVTTIYASVAIGQLFQGHRIVGAVASYFGLTTITSVIMYVLFIALGLFSFRDPTFLVNQSSIGYMIDTFKISGILSIITAVLLYTVTYMLMKKKLNLS